MKVTSHTDSLRQRLAGLPGTQEQKARACGVSVSWLQKFLDGRIKQPRSDRYEQIRKYAFGGPAPDQRAA